jgi:hypothetical protein
VLGDQGADLSVAELTSPLGRTESLGVEGVGDLAAAAARLGEFGDAGDEGGVVRQLIQAGDGADGLPGGLAAAGPGDGDVDELAGPGDGGVMSSMKMRSSSLRSAGVVVGALHTREGRWPGPGSPCARLR